MVDAVVRETTDLPTDGVEFAVGNVPGLEWPRLRCFFYFRHEDPTVPEVGRIQSWSMQDLREVWYNMNKSYSRAASRVAISQLMNEINILGEPLRAEERFGLLVSNKTVAYGVQEEVHAGKEEMLEEGFEQILRIIMMENSGVYASY